MWRAITAMSPITVPLPSPLFKIEIDWLGALSAPVAVLLVIPTALGQAAHLTVTCICWRRRNRPGELGRGIDWTDNTATATPSDHCRQRRNVGHICLESCIGFSRRPSGGAEGTDEIKQIQIINGAGNDRLRLHTSQKGLREPLPVCRMETGG